MNCIFTASQKMKVRRCKRQEQNPDSFRALRVEVPNYKVALQCVLYKLNFLVSHFHINILLEIAHGSMLTYHLADD